MLPKLFTHPLSRSSSPPPTQSCLSGLNHLIYPSLNTGFILVLAFTSWFHHIMEHSVLAFYIEASGLGLFFSSTSWWLLWIWLSS